MAHKHLIVRPGQDQGSVLSEAGQPLKPPQDWEFLVAGDATITRSVKAKGPTWVVQIKKGRRMISKGIWANKIDIHTTQKEVAAKRATPEYAKRRQSDLARRLGKHEDYVDEFFAAIIAFLAFHPRYQDMAQSLAQQVTAHATPVGSGTVARTKRIPVAARAKAAVIAWLRHQTTTYDSMAIARIKGRRREVRRQLAAKSIALLHSYRQGADLPANCPLQKVLG